MWRSVLPGRFDCQAARASAALLTMTRMAVEAAPTGSRGSSLAPSLSRITGKLFDVKRRGRKRRPNRSRRAELASHLDGKTYGANPLVERRNILAELVANCTGSALDFSEHFEGDGSLRRPSSMALRASFRSER